eukprot:TRINITY_DN4899_c0_g1_i1.p2 TRINITY_DN4899_c0_g1~~TRINITY_DN4899_c0_g1_i1.p2  ORF type:complete len:255 (+),score=61.67 TRINITY_DN4899_c0_g1_i1:56-766(+)
MQERSANTVLLAVTHSLLATAMPELRFDLHATVGDVKERLYRATGTAPAHQQLALLDELGTRVAALSDDSRKLGFYSPADGWRLHIVDTNPLSLARGGGLEDVSQVQRYVMPEEVYASRENTVRKAKEREAARAQAGAGSSAAGPSTGDAAAAALPLGARCEIYGGRRGAIRFVGPAPALGSGTWVGIELDEATGKNNGTVNGIRLFSCAPSHGIVLRPDKVAVGDFPPHDELEEI